MNAIGHPYVAKRVLGRLTGDLVLGSYLPDIVPFVSNSVFEFGEIHEGGEKFLELLSKRRPERRGLAWGMLCHGIEFGADKFSRSIVERFEDKRGEYGKRIAKASGISLEMASRSRFHNFLWWGVDVQILRREQGFVEDLAEKFSQIDAAGAATLLAECFGKEIADVSRDISFLLKPYTPERFRSVRGLVEIWANMAAGLPQKDQVDIDETEKIFEDCALLIEESLEDILEEVVVGVRNNVMNLRALKPELRF